MTWLLTILMLQPDGTATRTEAGIMVNEAICNIAGAGFAAVLKAETPGLVVGWTCDDLGVAA